MQANDILMKKWCFGMGRSKARVEAAMNNQGELQTYHSFPKYRTIVFKVTQATEARQTMACRRRAVLFVERQTKED